MLIHRLQGLAEAETARGATAVIDTFRAFTTAAFAHDAGVGTHMVVATVAEARMLKDANPNAILCGEDHGITPDDFDIGNSPAEVLAIDVAGRTLIQRSSAGTRCVLAALGSADASPVHPTSLVVASATADAMQSFAEVSLVASGRFGVEPAIEDDLTADFIAAILNGLPTPDTIASTIDTSDSAEKLRTSAWAHADDVELCCDIDRFAFHLTATMHPGGYALIHRSEP